MKLNTAQQALVTHLADVEVDPLAAVVPVFPVAWGGYVWAAPDWIEPPDDESFCDTRTVGLVVDLIASTVDIEHSQAWLNDRVDEVWAAGVCDIGDNDSTFPERASRPARFSVDGAGELLVVTVTFSRFNLED